MKYRYRAVERFWTSFYTKGDGVVQDYVEAYKWFGIASSQGYENGKKGLTTLKSRMTTEQIAEAQRLSREFVPRKEKPD